MNPVAVLLDVLHLDICPEFAWLTETGIGASVRNKHVTRHCVTLRDEKALENVTENSQLFAHKVTPAQNGGQWRREGHFGRFSTPN